LFFFFPGTKIDHAGPFFFSFSSPRSLFFLLVADFFPRHPGKTGGNMVPPCFWVPFSGTTCIRGGSFPLSDVTLAMSFFLPACFFLTRESVGHVPPPFSPSCSMEGHVLPLPVSLTFRRERTRWSYLTPFYEGGPPSSLLFPAERPS